MVIGPDLHVHVSKWTPPQPNPDLYVHVSNPPPHPTQIYMYRYMWVNDPPNPTQPRSTCTCEYLTPAHLTPRLPSPGPVRPLVTSPPPCPHSSGWTRGTRASSACPLPGTAVSAGARDWTWLYDAAWGSFSPGRHTGRWLVEFWAGCKGDYLWIR